MLYICIIFLHFLLSIFHQTDDIDFHDPTIEKQILSGIPAIDDQFPYQASIVFDNEIMCPGALISANWVVTAAHCAKRTETAIVYLGSIKLFRSRVKRQVTQGNIVLHAAFEQDDMANDIALLKMKTVDLDHFIQKVDLPQKPKTGNPSSYVGESAIVSSWGQTRDHNKRYGQSLLWNHLYLTNIEECKKFYAIKPNTSKQFICAIQNEMPLIIRDDSGGPLYLLSKNILIGIVAQESRNSCDYNDASPCPKLFIRIDYHLDWITKQCG